MELFTANAQVFALRPNIGQTPSTSRNFLHRFYAKVKFTTTKRCIDLEKFDYYGRQAVGNGMFFTITSSVTMDGGARESAHGGAVSGSNRKKHAISHCLPATTFVAMKKTM